MNYSLLKKLRKSLGLSQEQVANQIGLTKFVYSKYECGKCIPPIDTLIKIATLYEVNVYEFFSNPL